MEFNASTNMTPGVSVVVNERHGDDMENMIFDIMVLIFVLIMCFCELCRRNPPRASHTPSLTTLQNEVPLPSSPC